jgi:ribonuclease E
VIVRTAGVGRSKADLQRDLDYLMGVWETFSKRLRAGHGPAPLYQESDIAIRTVRDLSTPQTEAIIVDDVEVHRQIVDFAHKLMPEDESRVQLHAGPKPLFHSFGIEPDFERMFARRIELPSGGSIVFDQAEALVAIDVNSGRTRTDGFDFEQIALKTNIEAAPVIARQIRLRDLGGIIVVDFIDMMKTGSMRTVERKFRESLAQDRARFKIGRISQFGLLELTRQRLGPGIDKKVFHICSRCRGTGHIRTVESRAAAILRRLGSALTLKGFSTVEVRAHPEVVDYLKSQCSEYLRALEYRCERQIRLIEAGDQVEDSVLRYLRTDGREVRPGGRRKR